MKNHNKVLNKHYNYLNKSFILSLDHWCNVCKFNNNKFDCNADNRESLQKGCCNKESMVCGTDVGFGMTGTGGWIDSVSDSTLSKGNDIFASCD